MNVVGLGAVPATVRAVVPSVSVKTPELLTLIWFPFLSVPDAEPVPEFCCTLSFVPSAANTFCTIEVVVEEPVTTNLYAEPSVTVDVNPVELGPP